MQEEDGLHNIKIQTIVWQNSYFERKMVISFLYCHEKEILAKHWYMLRIPYSAARA